MVALYLLCANLLGQGLGPFLTATQTHDGFRDPSQLRNSMPIAAGTMMAMDVAVISTGLQAIAAALIAASSCGSFNFNPRSANLNTELGFVIDSTPWRSALAGHSTPRTRHRHLEADLDRVDVPTVRRMVALACNRRRFRVETLHGLISKVGILAIMV